MPHVLHRAAPPHFTLPSEILAGRLGGKIPGACCSGRRRSAAFFPPDHLAHHAVQHLDIGAGQRHP